MLVSVIIAVYNGQEYLSSTIESVLHQTYEHFELIIVDDGSTDNSLTILTEYKSQDSRIKLITQSNQGVSAARNTAIQESKGEWIFLMDQDDIAMSNRLERQLKFIKENPDVTVASYQAYLITDNHRVIGVTGCRPTSREQFKHMLSENSSFAINWPAIRKDVVVEAGGYRNVYPEDIDLYDRIAENGHLILVQDEFLMKYRIHSQMFSFQRLGPNSHLIYPWLTARKLARLHYEPEPSLEEFSVVWRRKKLIERLSTWMVNKSLNFYKLAGYNFIQKRYLQMLLFLSISICMYPPITLQRLYRNIKFYLKL
jgi:glycosyltransferase involved in cell wall biosynthesis